MCKDIQERCSKEKKSVRSVKHPFLAVIRSDRSCILVYRCSSDWIICRLLFSIRSTHMPRCHHARLYIRQPR